jgi:NTE family protein
MESLDTGYCLVLSGGGAKGVYHLGVWRALKELGIGVDAFIGASIGAIIAAFLAQGSDSVIEEIGRSITVDSILDLPGEFTEDGELRLDRGSFAGAQEFLGSLWRNKGLDTDPLRELLSARLDEVAVRNTGKDLGIITVNLSELEHRELFLEDIEEGKLVDYLMASAAFPGFEQPVIDGSRYVDGGVYDNIPFAMARSRGYRRVIVSDISGAGRARKPEIAGGITVYIKNSIGMGGVLDFDRRFLDDFTLLGYLDAMKAFGRYLGYAYFLEPDPEAETAFAAAMGGKPGPMPEFPEWMRSDRRGLLKSLECAASILEVERIRAYGYSELAAAVATKKAEVDSRLARLGEGDAGERAGTLEALRKAVADRRLDGSPYYYWRLVEDFAPKPTQAMLKKALVALRPELPAGVGYLSGIGD